MADIFNTTSNTLLSGTSGNDNIRNGEVTLIDSVNYKYSINGGSNISIDGETGNDYIENKGGNKITIDGGTGDDDIWNYGGFNFSINGGAGNDSIYNSPQLLISLPRKPPGYLPLSDEILLPDNNTLIGGDGDDYIQNVGGSNVTITGGNGDDYIHNENYKNYPASNVKIDGGDGNDVIDDSGKGSVTIDGGNGDDTIQGGSVVYGGAGNDSIIGGKNTTIDGSDGNDYILSDCNASIDGGSGNDSIYVHNSDDTRGWAYLVTINGGAGNDLISVVSGSDNRFPSDNLFKYSEGDGNDTIYGFNDYSTLQILTDSKISANMSDNDIIFAVDDTAEAITFKDVFRNDSATIKVLNKDGELTTYTFDKNGTITDENNNVSLTSPFRGTFDASNYSNVDASNDDLQVTLTGGKDNSVTLIGGTADDSIQNFTANSSLVGGAGNDTITNKTSYTETLTRQVTKTIPVPVPIYDYVDETITASEMVKRIEKEIKEINDSITSYMKKADEYYEWAKDGLTDWWISQGNDATQEAYNLEHIDLPAKQEERNKYASLDADSTLKTDNKIPQQTGWTKEDSVVTETEPYSVTHQTNNVSTTIIGGKGDDYVINEAANFLYEYTFGDGNDIIEGFNETSTINISGGSYTASTRGNDIILNVGGDSITLKDAVDLSAPNINGVEVDAWSIKNLSVAYGTYNNPHFKINGISSTAGLSLNDKIITIADSALNKSDISIDGDDYTLALADDVTQSTITPANWNQSDTYAIYAGSSTTEGYSLASDSRSITYSTASEAEQFTLSGISSTDGILVNDKVVTLMAKNLGAEVVTISAGYSLALGDDVVKGALKPAGWATLENGNVAYKTDFATAGYSLADNQISYVEALESETLAELSGINTSAIPLVDTENNLITFAKDNFAENIAVVSSEIRNFEFSEGDYDKAFTATEKADKITVGGSHILIDGAKGNDKIENNGTYVTINGGLGSDSVTMGGGSNTFVYASGDGKDVLYNFGSGNKIQIIGTTKIEENIKNSDVVFKVGKGTITLRDAAADMTITLVDDNDEVISSNTYTANGIISGNTIELAATLKRPYTQGDNISVVDATKVKNGAAIAGISSVDFSTFIGGDGKDTLISNDGDFELTGGKGNDLFGYNGGNVTITDYATTDKISLGSFSEASYDFDGDDVILSYGEGKELTIKNGKDKEITFASRKVSTKIYTDTGVFDGKNKTLKLAADLDGNFSAAKYSKLVTIDGASVNSAIEIIGNSKANYIIAGSGGATLNGDKGKDTLVGGEGKDIFIYNNKSGNKIIKKYSVEDGDIISLASGAEITQVTTKKDNAVLKVGSNTITIENAAKFNFVENGVEKIYDGGNLVNGDSVTLDSSFKSTFNLNEHSNYNHVSAELGKKAVTLKGNASDNSLNGGKGKDVLNGGEGNDTLWGGKGNDSLWGGDGSDTFVYQAGTGNDIIGDYNYDDGDLLRILDKHGNVLSDPIRGNGTYNGDDLTLSIKGGGKLILEGVGTSATVNINGNDRTF